jgi:serine/threonine-protein kinase
MQQLVETVVDGRYELTGIIGQGGQSVVYRGFDRHEGRGVAVKMLSDHEGNDPVIAARFAREQEALVALAGTSAVAVYDLCRAPTGALCLVMELLEGADLEHRLGVLEARDERFPLKDLDGIFAPVVDTLERAHDAGILHRDVKPANVFILADGSGVRLLDFGFSRMRSAVKLTHAGTILGSPSYIAPEAWMGKSEELDGRVDVYSLGVVLFRALAGRLPFETESLVGAFTGATTAKRPSLYALRPDLGPDADAWVERALAIDRGHRYASVRELWNGLLGVLHYTPPVRPFRPMQESLVSAWRAARSAFRRFIDAGGGYTPDVTDMTPPPRKSPPPLPAAAHADAQSVDEGWEELSDHEVEISPPEAEMSAIDAGWEEVTEDDLVHPSVPPAAKPAATKPAATKPAATKPAATKPAVTKPAATKPAATKPAAKPAMKKAVAKKAPAKKAPAKKPAAKKAPAKKPAAKKAPAKKPANNEPEAAKKPAAKKKPAVKTPAVKKVAVKKPAAKKKPAVKKASAKSR